MGRDRDPFDRTVTYLRDRLADWRPLQGAVISINGVAQTLDVSHTPVREALAMLAGEGLIVRTAAGYAGATYGPGALAAHYDLAALYVARALGNMPAGPWSETDSSVGSGDLWERVVTLGGDEALQAAHRRVAAQLAPFRAAAGQVLGDDDATRARLVLAWRSASSSGLATASRGYHARRRRAAARILATSLGLGKEA